MIMSYGLPIKGILDFSHLLCKSDVRLSVKKSLVKIRTIGNQELSAIITNYSGIKIRNKNFFSPFCTVNSAMNFVTLPVFFIAFRRHYNRQLRSKDEKCLKK